MTVEKPRRIYSHSKKVYFTYKTRYDEGTSFHGVPMHGWDEHFVFIGLNNKLFGVEEFYYDGHRAKMYTFFGITIGNGYTYSWEKK